MTSRRPHAASGALAGLRDRERRARRLLDGVRDHALILLDEAGLIVGWGAGATQVTGYGEEAALGRSFAMLHTGEDRAAGAPAHALANARRLGRMEQVCIQVRQDGSRFCANQALAPLPTEAGEPDGFALVVRDVTAGQEVEAALRRSEARLLQANDRLIQTAARLQGANRLLTMADEAGHIGHFRYDLAMQTVHWSDEVFRIHGLPPADRLPIATMLGACHPDDRDRVAELMRRAAIEGAPYRLETRVNRPDGGVREVVGSGQCERAPGGSIVAVFGFIQDVTEQRAVERELKARRRDISYLLANIPALIAYWDRDLRNRYGNPACLEWFGVAAEALEGMSLRDVLGPELFESSRAEIDAVLRGAPQTFERSLARADGTRRHMLSRFIPDIVGSEVVGFIAMAVDITDRKQAEDALARSEARLAVEKERAEQANRAKSDFLATMSHEIRTPMNGIIGMNRLLLGAELGATERRYAEAVRVSAESLMRIIDDILDVSRLESGKVEVEQVDFTMADVIAPAVELLTPQARQKRIALAATVEPEARPALRGDPMRLRQIVLNLLSNAIKFTEVGRVELTARARPAGDGRLALRVTVQDTGIGIDPAALPRLFTRFQQADGSVRRRFGGSGLGLHICKELIELMGGAIGVDSAPGGGSRFWVDLELPLAARQPERAAEQGPARLAGRRVLIVDDIEVNRILASQSMAAEGIAVTQLSCGAEALGAIQAAIDAGVPFDAVLLDHAMPGAGGPEIAAAARARFGARTPPMVLLSSIAVPGRSDPDFAHFVAGLTKPLWGPDLLACLRRVLAGAPAAPPPAAPVAAPAGASVLLADDNEINRLLIATLLEQAGHVVRVAEDGQQAIDAMAEGGIDVALMDVQMPLVDGVRATQAIRALPGAPGAAPIIALTANAMPSHRAQYLAAGMDDYLSKPVDPEALLRMVAKWAEIGRARAPAGAAPPLIGPPLIDEARQSALVRLLPAAQLDAVMAAFIAQDATAGMSPALDAGDIAELSRLAHGLKGSAGSLGAARLHAAAERLERSADLGCEPTRLAELVALARDVAADTKATLTRRRAAPPG